MEKKEICTGSGAIRWLAAGLLIVLFLIRIEITVSIEFKFSHLHLPALRLDQDLDPYLGLLELLLAGV